MPRRRKGAKAQARDKISVTIPEDLLRWLDARIADRTYASLSHAVEVAILELRKRDGKT